MRPRQPVVAEDYFVPRHIATADVHGADVGLLRPSTSRLSTVGNSQ